MKRPLLSLSLILLASTGFINAQTVSEFTAHSRAAAFFANQMSQASGLDRRVKAHNAPLTLAYSSQKDGNTCFYVYNRGEDDGFVIVGGDEMVREILAYVPQGHFVYDRLPDNMKWWLGQYENEIDSAIIIKNQLPTSVIKSVQPSTTTTQYQDIPDLITTKWGQRYPYNKALPHLPSYSENPVFVTGCTPTAFAQVLNYWEHPIHGVGSKSFTNDYGAYGSATFRANFANTTYDWANMLDDYSQGDYTEEQANAVATLMYHLGVSLDSWYFIGATGTISSEGGDVFGYGSEKLCIPINFDYDPRARLLNRNDMTAETWKDIIYSELLSGRPLIYSGVTSDSGVTAQGGGVHHTFICHGYSSSLDMFSFNWGWNGNYDGYYSLDACNVAIDLTNRDWQTILCQFQPNGRTTTQVSYGDYFTDNGMCFFVHNPLKKEVALARGRIPHQVVYYGDVVVPSHVTYNGEEYTVTCIGPRFSSPCEEDFGTHLNSLKLPQTLTSLDADAFCDSSIDSLVIPSNLTIVPQGCFVSSHTLKKIVFEGPVTRICSGAFGSCSMLEEVIIPSGLKEIYRDAFADCSALAEISLPASLERIEYGCFNNTSLIKMVLPANRVPELNSNTIFPPSIKEGVLYVPQAMIDSFRAAKVWQDWKYIKAIETMQLDYIGEEFQTDTLALRIVPDGAMIVGISNKYNHPYLHLSIPQNVSYKEKTYPIVSIGAYAFAEGNRTRIRSITFADSCTIKSIGAYAFSNTFDLQSIKIPSSVKEIDEMAFYNSRINQLFLENGVEKIGLMAMFQCPQLEYVSMPASFKYLGGDVFKYCKSLKKLVNLSDRIYDFAVMEDLPYFGVEDGDWMIYAGYSFDSYQNNGVAWVKDWLVKDTNSYVHHSSWSSWGRIESYQSPNSIIIDLDTLLLNVGEQRRITATVQPSVESANYLFWTSSNPEVALVSYNGTIWAETEGETIIKAISPDGQTVSSECRVIVLPYSVETKSDCLFYDDFSDAPIINTASHWAEVDTVEYNWRSIRIGIADIFEPLSGHLLTTPVPFSGGNLCVAVKCNPTGSYPELNVVVGNEKQHVYNNDGWTILTFSNVEANPSIRFSGNGGVELNSVRVFLPYDTQCNMPVITNNQTTDDKFVKFYYNGFLYIRRGGMIYDANGRLIR